MSKAMTSNYLSEMYSQIFHYVSFQLVSWPTLVQLVVIAVACWLAREATRSLRAWCDKLTEKCPAGSRAGDDLDAIIDFLGVIKPFFAAVIMWVAYELADTFPLASGIAQYSWKLFFSGLTLVRLFTDQMKNRFWAGILQFLIWLWILLFVLAPHRSVAGDFR